MYQLSNKSTRQLNHEQTHLISTNYCSYIWRLLLFLRKSCKYLYFKNQNRYHYCLITFQNTLVGPTKLSIWQESSTVCSNVSLFIFQVSVYYPLSHSCHEVYVRPSALHTSKSLCIAPVKYICQLNVCLLLSHQAGNSFGEEIVSYSIVFSIYNTALGISLIKKSV